MSDGTDASPTEIQVTYLVKEINFVNQTRKVLSPNYEYGKYGEHESLDALLRSIGMTQHKPYDSMNPFVRIKSFINGLDEHRTTLNVDFYTLIKVNLNVSGLEGSYIGVGSAYDDMQGDFDDEKELVSINPNYNVFEFHRLTVFSDIVDQWKKIISENKPAE